MINKTSLVKKAESILNNEDEFQFHNDTCVTIDEEEESNKMYE